MPPKRGRQPSAPSNAPAKAAAKKVQKNKSTISSLGSVTNILNTLESTDSANAQAVAKTYQTLHRSSYIATTLFPSLSNKLDAQSAKLLLLTLHEADSNPAVSHSSVITGGMFSFLTPSPGKFKGIYDLIMSDKVPAAPRLKLWLLGEIHKHSLCAGPIPTVLRSCVIATINDTILATLPKSLLEYHLAVQKREQPATTLSDSSTTFHEYTTAVLNLLTNTVTNTDAHQELTPCDIALLAAYFLTLATLLTTPTTRTVLHPYLTYHNLLPLITTLLATNAAPSLTNNMAILVDLLYTTPTETTVLGFQRVCNKLAATHPDLKSIAMATRSQVQRHRNLREMLNKVPRDGLVTLAMDTRIVADGEMETGRIVDCVIARVCTREGDRSVSVFSDEKQLFPQDTTQLSTTNYYLGTQFVDYETYFQTNFKLYQSDADNSVKSDLTDCVKRCCYTVNEETNKVSRKGWSRYGVDVNECKVVKKGKIRLGTKYHSYIEASVTIDLSMFGPQIRREWDDVGENDVLFLATIVPPAVVVVNSSQRDQVEESVRVVRGCTVTTVCDGEGNEITRDTKNQPRESMVRIFRVRLDPVQYFEDHSGRNKITDEALYGSINLLIRRKAAENNFKAVLETILALKEDHAENKLALPKWLTSVVLGYGDVDSVNYASPVMKRFAEGTVGLPKPGQDMDFGDAFNNTDHLHASFPGWKVNVESSKAKNPFYKLAFDKDGKKAITATAYTPKKMPNPTNLKFTVTQIEAVKSCLHPGLSLVVGPPGTGKTDVASHVISCLHRTYPSQRIVVIAHSNAALNDLFEKIIARGDVDERFMIRLGSGERDLKVDSTHDFSKRGRVQYTLARREVLLGKVQDLSESLGVSRSNERGPNGESSYTCETAMLFYKHHVVSRIQIFERKEGAEFPFKAFFNDAGGDFKDSFGELRELFEELEDFRAFELMRSMGKRSDYLMAKQAKIVAMTCTHAALARKRLLELDFKYDSVIVEEAGQMLEIETVIPLLMQNKDGSGGSRLKRVCLFGDHNQLPPVIQGRHLAKHGNCDQSFFSRMVRLGVKNITLDQQGRSREEICALYGWRYGGLGSLQHTKEGQFLKANAGFGKTMQFVNVEDYEGRGEHCPTPHYIQNLGEAEYVVATYQYMVLLGYPPEKISILTTYNGQKDLILDVLNRRCGGGTVFGMGGQCSVSTVDKFQGQQNDYILLSLVRTAGVGHLQDVRRLVVALSRAKLGLYVFGRRTLFDGCVDLRQAMEQFGGSGELELVQGEGYAEGGGERIAGKGAGKAGFKVNDIKTMGEIVHGMQVQIAQK